MMSKAMPVGVVLERRETDNKWIDHAWFVAGVLPGVEEDGGWREVARGDGWIQYHAATLTLELFSSETEGYKYNLSLEPPQIYVVMAPTDDPDDKHEIDVRLVTVCPYEAADYLDGSEDIVEAAPMPPVLAAWVAEFVETHHVDQPFVKRKRKPHPDKKGADNEFIPPPSWRARRGGKT